MPKYDEPARIADQQFHTIAKRRADEMNKYLQRAGYGKQRPLK